MNTMVQSEAIVKPRSDRVRIAAQTVKSVMTEHAFFNWKWVVFDIAVLIVCFAR
jgi:hypothetical protein